MALQIGDLYETTVEPGWRRVFPDGTVSTYGIRGNWALSNAVTGARPGKIWYTASADAQKNKNTFVALGFTGDKLRVYLTHSPNYSAEVSLVLDGEEYIVPCNGALAASNVAARLSFEKLDLDPDKPHYLRISVKDAVNDGVSGRWGFAFTEVDENAEILPYDGSDPARFPEEYLFIAGTSNQISGAPTMKQYNVDYSYCTKTDEYVEWTMYCSSAAIVMNSASNATTELELWVDDILYRTSTCYSTSSTNVWRTNFVYMSEDGKPGIHHFRLVNKADGRMSLNKILSAGHMCTWDGKYIEISPYATSATSTGWTCTASSTMSGYAPWMALRGAFGTEYPSSGAYGGWYSVSGKKTDQWLQYDTNRQTPVTAYTVALHSQAVYGRMPASVRFAGSDDGVNFDILDEWHPDSDYVVPMDFSAPKYECIRVLPRTVNYRYYRIFLDGAVVSSNAYLGICTWRLYVDPNAARYLVKKGDEYFGYDYDTQTLVPATTDNLTNNLLESGGIIWPEDIPSIADFDSNEYTVVSLRSKKLSADGSVGDSGILVFANDYYTTQASRILNVVIDVVADAGSTCKFAVSVDSGTTWQTIKDGQWAPISLSMDNLNTAKDALLANGADVTATADWNALGAGTIKFVFALSRPDADTQCALQSIAWKYDEAAQLISVDEKLERRLLKNTILVKAKENFDKLYVNVSTNGV